MPEEKDQELSSYHSLSEDSESSEGELDKETLNNMSTAEYNRYKEKVRRRAMSKFNLYNTSKEEVNKEPEFKVNIQKTLKVL
jgi:hypothetical protein